MDPQPDASDPLPDPPEPTDSPAQPEGEPRPHWSRRAWTFGLARVREVTAQSRGFTAKAREVGAQAREVTAKAREVGAQAREVTAKAGDRARSVAAAGTDAWRTAAARRAANRQARAERREAERQASMAKREAERQVRAERREAERQASIARREAAPPAATVEQEIEEATAASVQREAEEAPAASAEREAEEAPAASAERDAEAEPPQSGASAQASEATRQGPEVRAKARDRARGLAAAGADAWRTAAAQRATNRQARAERREAERRAAIAQREAEAAQIVAQRRAAAVAERQRVAIERDQAARRHYRRLVRKDRSRRARRRRLLLVVLVSPFVVAAGVGVAAYYVDTVPLPAELALPEATTVYFADGLTPIARLGSVNRVILEPQELNDAVKHAIVAAEDRSFWTNPGVDLRGVARASWNNLTGGDLQGASTISQQYARLAAGLSGVTYARKAREAVLAWKIDRSYTKDEILAFYLNTIPFGRGAYGIEAAAATFFGKTARRSAPEAEQLTIAEAMLLATLVKQPEPDPVDPANRPGYDPARGGVAAANSLSRWEYVRDGMVELGYLTPEQAQALPYPTTVRALDPDAELRALHGPTGLAVSHALSELRQRDPFRGQPADYIGSGGFKIVTTLDPRVQAAAEAAADIRRLTAPDVVRDQPANWQAALVAVEPGTGRVLAYYGGNDGIGADHAGWFFDANGVPTGFGQHPPGSSFKVYDLAEALRQGIPLDSHWDAPDVKEFPNSARTYGAPAGPVRNASSAPCQPECTLWESTVASLNVPFFDLTERLGVGNVIDMARRAGIDALWTSEGQRVDLGSEADDGSARKLASQTTQLFTTEVGIGQFGVTVLDHANGMATFAAGGSRASSHFVREVTQGGVRVYAEQLTRGEIGLTPEQVNELTWVLSQVPSAHLDNGWDAAGKTGTWQAGPSTTRNAHAWMVGYTGALACAVWLGTTDGTELVTNDGDDVYGSTHPAAIWRQFMTQALANRGLDPAQYRFQAPAVIPTAAS